MTSFSQILRLSKRVLTNARKKPKQTQQSQQTQENRFAFVTKSNTDAYFSGKQTQQTQKYIRSMIILIREKITSAHGHARLRAPARKENAFVAFMRLSAKN